MANKKDKIDINSLASMITGEAQLEQEQIKKERAKERAAERKRIKVDQKISVGEVSLEDEIERPAVVQNIKVYDWDAPIRLKIGFEKKAYFSVVIIAAIFVVYLAILGQYGLMASIVALLFFIYVSGVYEPIEIRNRITTRGIETPISIEEEKEIVSTSKLYEWYMLEDFAFYRKNEQIMLIIRTKLRFPTKLMLLLSEKKIKPIYKILEKKIIYRDIKRENVLDKIVYGEYIPLENVL